MNELLISLGLEDERDDLSNASLEPVDNEMLSGQLDNEIAFDFFNISDNLFYEITSHGSHGFVWQLRKLVYLVFSNISIKLYTNKFKNK